MAERYIELNNQVKIKKDDRYQFEKDKEAVRSYFIDHVNQNTVFFHNLKEKLDYLIENKYYSKAIFDQYTFQQIKAAFKLAYAKKFRFQSYMSAFKFYNNYALKTDDGSKYLERYEDRVAINALFFGEGDFDKAKRHIDNLIGQRYQPATPTFLNVGRERSGELVSCFLLDTPDTTEGIMYVVEASSQLSRFGGGVGINLSKLRAEGEAIKDVEGAASSPIGVAKILENTFNHFNQLGQRNGSGVAYLNIFHADIESFLDTKKINADENVRLKTLSIGVIAPDKFFELAEQDKPYFVFYPHSVEKEYGICMDDMDMTEWYDRLIDNPNVRKKKLDARQMLTKIAQIQQESGYPYFMFVDNANKYNALKGVGRIIMSNLCNEIYQIQTPSEIKSRNLESQYGMDISCNLGSLNIANVMESGLIDESVSLAMDALNTVAKQTSIDVVPSVKNANDLMRSVGLGAMNLHGYLAKNRIAYESREAKDFANTFFMMVNFYSLKRSMEIAVEEGFIFYGFEKSEYANGNYFNKYTNNSFSPRTDKVKKLFENIYVPTPEDWAELAVAIQKNGLAHSYRMAIAPTGSISYVQGATASIAPITEQVETRKYGDSTTHYPMPYMTNENLPYYKEAYDMDMFKYIDLVAVIQQHVDQGISTILYVSSDKTTRDLSQYFTYAHGKGLRGLYYTRTKLLSVDECLSCSV
ncbi:class 1b ribonucleoside-diphosphate reductase subunit alpha [Paenibacillus illinoisensis]|uniref:class 1b ribonucleoside-diphosphate reductase subunit alpha n=1 Tax=Paenibacillus illinoisensis TaxID=59845 RepID=UPI0030168BF3